MNQVATISCPQCDSQDISLYRQPASKFSGGGSQRAMRCRTCGHRAFGDDVPHGIVAAPARTVSRPERARPTPQPKAKVAPPAPRPVPQAAQAQPEPAPEAHTHTHAHAHGETCAWKGCDEIARDGSKYCSRNCSNKNARARHAARKRRERQRSAA